MLQLSKKLRLLKKKKISNKKSNGGGSKKTKYQYNFELNYQGPKITFQLFQEFFFKFRLGYNLTENISKFLSDPHLTENISKFLSDPHLICQSNTSYSTDVTHNIQLNLSPLENSIMISSNKSIPHYYLFKPHIIDLIQQLLLLLIVAGIVTVLISREEHMFSFSILALPLSAYISYYFLSGKKNWIMEIVFAILASSWIWNYFWA